MDSITVAIANVKPSISLTGLGSVDEGSTHTYNFTVSDPGVDTHTITTDCGANGDKVSGSDAYSPITGFGSFQCFFADGDATTNVTATVTDSDGASDTDNQVVVVTISNVAPTVTLAAGNDLSVDEGSQHTYSFTTSDPGEDDFALLSTDCGLNGTQVGLDTFNTTTGAGSFVCSFPDGPASSTVSVQVEDSDGADSNERHPDGRHRQRRPDGHPGGRQRPVGRRGQPAHLQLHHAAIRARTRSPCSRPTAASTARRSASTPSTPPPVPAASSARSPTARPRAPSRSRSRTAMAPTATPTPRPWPSPTSSRPSS